MSAAQIFSRMAESFVTGVQSVVPLLSKGPREHVIEAVDKGRDLFVYHHLGLGDMIHCNGMIRYLLQQLDAQCRVHVFCKSRNLDMTAWMYRDEPRVVLQEVPADKGEQAVVNAVLRHHSSRNYLCVGHRKLRKLEKEFPKKFFDELFYYQVGIPYSVRYSHCFWQRERDEEERVFEKLVTESPYVFVHDDPARGFRIDTSSIPHSIVRNDITESIFHLGKVLENAAQVHCMESSIRCMLESLQMQNAKLYYHNFRYVERPLGNATCQAWTEVTYV